MKNLRCPFRCLILFLGMATASLQACAANELWVDASAAAGGDGSQAAPFQAIGDATKSVEPGTTITIKAGVYNESVKLTTGGTADAPVTLRAAEGERVVLSGFREITGWEKLDDHTYTTVVDGPVHDLYVGYVPQQVAESGDGKASPWMPVESADTDAATIGLGEALHQVTNIQALAADPADLRIFHYLNKPHRPFVHTVTAIDLGANRITLEQGRTIKSMSDKDLLAFINHRALIDQPGEWACQPDANGKTKIFFWPRDPQDLERTQSRHNTRAMLAVGHWQHRIAHVNIQGLELTGSLNDGVAFTDTDHLQVTDCIAHNNGRYGIATRRSSHARIAHNFVLGNNGNGLVVATTTDALVEENEVAFNYADGIIVSGDTSGKRNEPASDRATVRRNYMHHHQILEHPDNFQTYFGANDLTLEDNLGLFAGQGLMTQDVQGARFAGNVFFGTNATILVLAHGKSSDWAIERNTLGLGGWGTFIMDGQDYRVDQNILYNTRIHGGAEHTGNHNLYWDTDPTQAIIRGPKPKLKAYPTLEQFTQDLGEEADSLQADPQLANMPLAQATSTHFEKCSTDFLLLRQTHTTPTAGFSPGTIIEINGDGIVRKVTEVTDDGIRFEPALPEPPFRGPLVWNWGTSEDFTLDVRPHADSPAHTLGPDGQPVGATLDVQAYMAGDFNGDGQRDLPMLRPDILQAIPNPNAPAIPNLLP